MGRVGALLAASVDPSLLATHGKDRLEEPCFRTSGQESFAKFAQDRVIEPRVSEIEAEQVFPFNPSAHRFCSLTVGESFNIVENGNDGEAPRGFCWTTPTGKQIRELLISKDWSQDIPHTQTQTSFREGGMSYPPRFFGNSPNRLRMHGHTFLLF
jgi:hypothetical protein